MKKLAVRLGWVAVFSLAGLGILHRVSENGVQPYLIAIAPFIGLVVVGLLVDYALTRKRSSEVFLDNDYEAALKNRDSHRDTL